MPFDLTDAEADLVVVDADGGVFTRELPPFVWRRAVERGDDPDAVWARWHDELRLEFWEGRLDPTTMWSALFPGDNPAALTAALEAAYRPGPLFRRVVSRADRLWLLCDQRSGWLLPRLHRFGLADRFERIVVSDSVGAAKPHDRAYAPVLHAMQTSTVVMVDDVEPNVEAARALGIDARLITAPAAGMANRAADAVLVG